MVDQSPSILVVDGLSETTAVLKAVFEPRGLSVNRIRQSQLPSRLPVPPSVVIWHDDDSATSPTDECLQGVPRVFIGKSHRSATDAAPQFSQPFEYCELLRTIESLLTPPRTPIA